MDDFNLALRLIGLYVMLESKAQQHLAQAQEEAAQLRARILTLEAAVQSATTAVEAAGSIT